MGKKTNNIPDWCVVLGNKLASRCMPVEDVVEAIMFDVEMLGEDCAKRKWQQIAKEKDEKR